jgi:hypothetical protein
MLQYNKAPKLLNSMTAFNVMLASMAKISNNVTVAVSIKIFNMPHNETD